LQKSKSCKTRIRNNVTQAITVVFRLHSVQIDSKVFTGSRDVRMGDTMQKLTAMVWLAGLGLIGASTALAQSAGSHNAPGGPRDKVEKEIKEIGLPPLPPPPPEPVGVDKSTQPAPAPSPSPSPSPSGSAE
jgi:hypothetical protein